MPTVVMSYLGSTVTPGEAGNQVWALIYVFIVFAGVSAAVMAMNSIERRALARFSVRLGPTDVGRHGLPPPAADAIKQMLNEDRIPAEADPIVYWVAPMIGLLGSFAAYTVVPFGPSQAVSDMNIGIVFMLGVLSLGALGNGIAAWASNSHEPLLDALQSSAQMVSYKVAMGLAAVSAILMTSMNEKGTGYLSMIEIVREQQRQGVWFICKFFPLGLLAFVIFAIAMIAETDRAISDVAEAESKPTARYPTESSSLYRSRFLLAEYTGVIAASSIAVTLWLGGWMRPFPDLLNSPAWDAVFSLFPGLTFLGLAAIAAHGVVRMPGAPGFRLQRIGQAAVAAVFGVIALGLLAIASAGRSTNMGVGPRLASSFRENIDCVYWFGLKLAVLMCLLIWYRATQRRHRFDQWMKFGWKGLLPISLGVLLLTAIVGVIVS
jgi:NADH-quinone oxidoreductase subunit H